MTCRQVSTDRTLGSVLKPFALCSVPFDLGEPAEGLLWTQQDEACGPPGAGWTELTAWRLETDVRSGPRSWYQP